jgi:SAM-dependent methyltransferase
MKTEIGEYIYDQDFFDYIEGGARQSARIIIPLIAGLTRVRSVLDVGCGRGVWLREWNIHGVKDFIGVDGSYVNDGQLVIAPEKFVRHDVSKPFNLGRRFDLVQSLEVGEHVLEACADTFVANIAVHGDFILFSAAVPGQGGEFHVNEQPHSYWRDKFLDYGFRAFDWLRPQILKITRVQPWYRYNTLLFMRESIFDRASAELLNAEIPPERPVPTLAPLSWRIRNGLLAQLPRNAVHRLAILRHRLVLMQQRRGTSIGPS